jgi:superfamily II DNA or RNA helicase
MLIIDECHGAISKERAGILKKFRPERLYGLSGSPRRSKDDGRTDAIFFYLGPIIASHQMPMVAPLVDCINTRVDIPMSYQYSEIEESMMNNEVRNKLIAGLATGEAGSGHKVLILVKRREHCKKIMDLVGSIGAYYADSDDSERNDELLAMRSGERSFGILVGTMSLLAAGVDIPSLDVLIIGGALKSDVLLQQGSGRILRLFEGKEGARVYDLYDYSNPILRNQFNERVKFYTKQEWQMICQKCGRAGSALYCADCNGKK